MKQPLTRLLAAACAMSILILDAKDAAAAAAEGINLCIKALIPALFPFFILSSVITSTLTANNSSVFSPLEKFCGLPRGSGGLMLIGFLGGYPTGARCVAQAVTEGTISPEDGARMLPLCNNCGPSFLFGIIAPILAEYQDVWIIWLILIISCIFTARILPPSPCTQSAITKRMELPLHKAVEGAVRSTGILCGWVISFKIILSYLEKSLFLFLPEILSILFSGILELTNGCFALERIYNPGIRILICAVITSFGGICVTLQTKSVSDSVSFRHYLPVKMIQCLFCILLTVNYLIFSYGTGMIQLYVPLVFIDFLIIYSIYSPPCKKYSSNPVKNVV